MTDDDVKAAIAILEKHRKYLLTAKTTDADFRQVIAALETLAAKNERYREALEKITQQPVIAGGLLMQKIATAALTSPSQPDQSEAPANRPEAPPE